jgi:hypothetical protein
MWTTIVIGAGATAFLDLTSVLRALLFRETPPNYGFVGRWIAHAVGGRFALPAVAEATPVQGERIIGWTAHYLIGIGYAAVLLVAWPGWADAPTFAPAMIVGIGSVLAPFLIMQPGMGAGFFASRTPNPNLARLKSLIAHTLFGLGLYAAALTRLALS